MDDESTAKIATLNDTLRSTFKGGSICMTAGVNALPDGLRRRIFDRVRRFDAFTPDNDPHDEHDCGLIEVEHLSIIWKIDYYDPTFSVGSEAPSDPSLTGRLLTIMLAEEN